MEWRDVRVEVERASEHYDRAPSRTGIDNRTRRFVVDAALPYVEGDVLELGYVDGLWTDALIAAGHAVEIVEGAARHLAHARAKYAAEPSVRVRGALFEEFQPRRRYDTVLAGDMLRYLDDPRRFLRRAREWISPRGTLIATLPNSRSLHRRVGALLGMELCSDRFGISGIARSAIAERTTGTSCATCSARRGTLLAWCAAAS